MLRRYDTYVPALPVDLMFMHRNGLVECVTEAKDRQSEGLIFEQGCLCYRLTANPRRSLLDCATTPKLFRFPVTTSHGVNEKDAYHPRANYSR